MVTCRCLPVLVLLLGATVATGRDAQPGPPPKPTTLSDADQTTTQEALFLLAFGRGEAARRVFDDVVARNPNCPEAYLMRSIVFAGSRNYSAAVADCDRAIRHKPTDEGAHKLRAGYLSLQGKHDEAIRAYAKVIELTPDKDEAYAQRGVLLARQGQWDRALADFDRALKINPTSSTALKNRAGCRQARDDLSGAVEDYRAAVALDDKLSEAHTQLAVLLSRAKDGKLRDGKAALKHAARAVDLTAGTDAAALDALASARAECGQFDAAVTAVEKALALGANAVDAAAMRRRLEHYKSGQPYRE